MNNPRNSANTLNSGAYLNALARNGWNGKQWNPDIGHTPFYPLTQHYIGGLAVPTADYTKE